MLPVCFQTETETKHLMIFSNSEKKTFLDRKRSSLIKSSLTAGKVVFLSVSYEILWKLCLSDWVLLLNAKFIKMKVVCSSKVLMILMLGLDRFFRFYLVLNQEKKRKGNVSAELLFLVTTFDTRVRLTVLGWATYLWCTNDVLSWISFLSFLFGFVLYQALSAGCFFYLVYINNLKTIRIGFVFFIYLGRMC